VPTISLWAMMSSNRAGRYFSIHGSDARTRPLGFSTSPSMILGDNKASNHNPLEKPLPRMACLRAAAQALVSHTSTQGTKWRGSAFEHVWPVTQSTAPPKKTNRVALVLPYEHTYIYIIPIFSYKLLNTCCGHMSQTKFIPPKSYEFAEIPLFAVFLHCRVYTVKQVMNTAGHP
jgi:hypothetical protein